MTLITTIINSNVRCIAGDTKHVTDEGKEFYYPKVFKLKDSLVAYHNWQNPKFYISLIDNSLNWSYKDFISNAIIDFNNLNDPSQVTGFTVIMSNEAYMHYFPWNIKYDLQNNKSIIVPINKYYDESQMQVILFKKVILNPPFKDYNESNDRYEIEYQRYEKLISCFNNTLNEIFDNQKNDQNYELITKDNCVKIIKMYYSKVMSDKNLHEKVIGGGLDIGIFNNEGEPEIISFKSPDENN